MKTLPRKTMMILLMIVMLMLMIVMSLRAESIAQAQEGRTPAPGTREA